MDGTMIYVLVRLIIGALATFLAIILWSKTRDSAWMFIVIGTVAGYGNIVYSTLDIFGIVSGDKFEWFGIPTIPLVLTNMPTIFFIIAFLIMILRKKGV